MNYTHCSAHEIATLLQHFKTDESLHQGVSVYLHYHKTTLPAILVYVPEEGDTSTPFQVIHPSRTWVYRAFADGKLAPIVGDPRDYSVNQTWSFPK